MIAGPILWQSSSGRAPPAKATGDKPGVILDYDDIGRLIGLKILDASKTLPDVTDVRFHRTE
jgi:hypothetical protein